jgi:threonine/homoserine/homoserine lactone efflux protein
MIPIEHLVAFVLASIVLIVIPGPGVLFVVGRSIALGRRAGVLSVLGNSLGNIPALLLVAFGVGAIVASSVVAFTAIKIVGAAYLVYLGVQAIRHRRGRIEQGGRAPASVLTLLRQGFLVGMTNPKTIAFFVAVLPQFVAREAGPVWLLAEHGHVELGGQFVVQRVQWHAAVLEDAGRAVCHGGGRGKRAPAPATAARTPRGRAISRC